MRTRKQLSTSLVVLCSDDNEVQEEDNLASGDAEDDAEGNVWSVRRLKSRFDITRMRVATFSGASLRARRTGEKSKSADHRPISPWQIALTIIGCDEGKHVGRAVEYLNVLHMGLS